MENNSFSPVLKNQISHSKIKLPENKKNAQSKVSQYKPNNSKDAVALS
jgi:hypothetical protein